MSERCPDHPEIVMLHFCPKCRGVWLDRGELDKILERETSYQQEGQAPPRDPRLSYQRVSDDDNDYRRGKGKKSIWHELFD